MHEDSTVEILEKSDFPVDNRQYAVDVGLIDAADPFEMIRCDTCEIDIPFNILHGHIDGTITVDDRTVLFEHKAIGSYAYNLLDKEFPIAYVKQCCCYIKGLHDRGFDIDSALILLRSKDLANYKQIKIEYDIKADRAFMSNEWNELNGYLDDVVKGCIEMHDDVERMALNGELPDRPYELSHFKCKFCRFQNTCWDGYVEEVRALGKDNSIPETSPLSELARKQHILTAEKKRVEDELQEVKKKLKSEMFKGGIKEGAVGNFRIKTTAFNKSSLDESKIPDEVKEVAAKTIPIVFVTVEEIDKEDGIS